MNESTAVSTSATSQTDWDRFQKKIDYTAVTRGFHYFKTFLQPKENEVLRCHFETGNCYDMFAEKMCNENGRRVGLSHYTFYP